jgi:hypothetical protein
MIFGQGNWPSQKLIFQLNSSHGWCLMHTAQKNIFSNVTARHGWPLPKSILGLNNSASIRAVTSRGEPCPKNDVFGRSE